MFKTKITNIDRTNKKVTFKVGDKEVIRTINKQGIIKYNNQLFFIEETEFNWPMLRKRPTDPELLNEIKVYSDFKAALKHIVDKYSEYNGSDGRYESLSGFITIYSGKIEYFEYEQVEKYCMTRVMPMGIKVGNEFVKRLNSNQKDELYNELTWVIIQAAKVLKVDDRQTFPFVNCGTSFCRFAIAI